VPAGLSTSQGNFKYFQWLGPGRPCYLEFEAESGLTSLGA
jgi:hypothetical protein